MTVNFPEFIERKYLEWQNREGKRKSIEEFAIYIGVSQPALSLWMGGKRTPSAQTVHLLAEIFGNEVYDVLGLPRPNPDLHSDDPAAVRQTLLGIVHQILADRHGKRLVAQVELYFDKKKETGGNPTVPISHTPVGAPIYRHSLKIEYDIQRQGNPLPIK